MKPVDEVEISKTIICTYHEKLLDRMASDVIIVGAGPSGLVAAFYLARIGLKVTVLEKRLSPGGGIWGGGMAMNVARKYGMVQPAADDSHAVRAVFIMDPEAKVRAVLYYPSSMGRNFQEILRMIVALQTADKHKVATPADWQPGDDVIVPPPGSCGSAQERVQGKESARCLDWFMCLREIPKSDLDLPPMWKK